MQYFWFCFISGCGGNKVSSDTISFVPGKSVANLVQVEGERLLSIEYMVINESNHAIGPFTIKMNIVNQQLLNSLGENRGYPDHPYLGNPFTLQPNEKHGYGGTMIVKKEVSAKQLRSIIEDSKSLEVQLLDTSGEIIASEWIQKLNVIK